MLGLWAGVERLMANDPKARVLAALAEAGGSATARHLAFVTGESVNKVRTILVRQGARPEGKWQGGGDSPRGHVPPKWSFPSKAVLNAELRGSA